MKKEKITNRSTAYIYQDLGSIETFVYKIETPKKVFIIDTFCGSLSMEPIISDLSGVREKKIIIINTHFHWDHVWGNSAFNGEIISHCKCRAYLEKYWEKQLEEEKKYLCGRAEKKLPTITFNDYLGFPEEGIELFYSPGHTADSISIYDHADNILYVGDNLEKPLIYVEDDDLETYINTLEQYKKYRPWLIMAGHSIRLKIDNVQETIDYLKKLKAGDELVFNTEYEQTVHENNRKVISKKTSK